MWEVKGTRIIKVLLKKEDKFGELILYGFKTYDYSNQDNVVLAK